MIEIRGSWRSRDLDRKSSTVLNRIVASGLAGTGLRLYRWRSKASSIVNWTLMSLGSGSRKECWLHWYPFALKLVCFVMPVAHPEMASAICLAHSFWVPLVKSDKVPYCHAVWMQEWSYWHSNIYLPIFDDGCGIEGRYVFWWKQTSVCRTYEPYIEEKDTFFAIWI